MMSILRLFDRKPSMDAVPDMTDATFSTQNIVSFFTCANGVYDRFTHKWSAQAQPHKDDLFIYLVSDSMGMSVKADIRGRVVGIEWVKGWNQNAVKVAWPDGGTDRFPLSEVHQHNTNRRIWTTVR